MSPETIGKLCALASAMTWAVALVLFKRGGERIPPLAMNIFKNVVALLLLGASLAVVGAGGDTLAQFSHVDILRIAVSGFLGITVADTLFFFALNRCGVGAVAVVDCLYTPFMFLFAWLMLGEGLNGWQSVGVVLILAAVLMCSGSSPLEERSPRGLLLGVLAAAAAMATMAFGVVLVKPLLADTSLLVITTARLLFGTLLAAPILLWPQARATIFRALSPSIAWRTALPAAILGSYVALLLWMAGYKFAPAAVAAVLNQTSVFFSLGLAAIFLRERFTVLRVAATLLAFLGIVFVSL